MKAFQGYQVNDGLLAAAKAGLHGAALPAGISRAGDHHQRCSRSTQTEIFEGSRNRLHAQKAVMDLL